MARRPSPPAGPRLVRQRDQPALGQRGRVSRPPHRDGLPTTVDCSGSGQRGTASALRCPPPWTTLEVRPAKWAASGVAGPGMARDHEMGGRGLSCGLRDERRRTAVPSADLRAKTAMMCAAALRRRRCPRTGVGREQPVLRIVAALQVKYPVGRTRRGSVSGDLGRDAVARSAHADGRPR